MLQITDPVQATVLSVNVRDERHGDEHVLAMDIGLSFTVSNALLDQFQDGLREALYSADLANDYLVLRFSVLRPLSLYYELAGRTVEITPPGIGDERDVIELPNSEINKFVVETKEGGSVIVTCRVQCSELESATVGELCGMLRKQIGFAFRHSEPAQEGAAANDGGGKVIDATSAFLEAAT